MVSTEMNKVHKSTVSHFLLHAMPSSSSLKPQQNQEWMRRGGDTGATVQNGTDVDEECASSLERCQGEFSKYFDHNPPLFGSDFNEIEAGYIGKDTRKRSLEEMGMRKYGISTEVDLDLRLALPGVSLGGKSSKTSPISSQETHISFDLNPNDDKANSSMEELPSLALMGCPRCFIYVMVSEADPKCPNCKSYSLLDKFRDNPAKRTRNN